MKKFNPREMMEKAVEVMANSSPEPRTDGKASPLVGAVLWNPNGSIETAYRCELRDGDHAEFTLLERKNRHRKLDGSVLFATLEPCAQGARNKPKLSCAERIVLARIKQVWVGIEDPDPKVDRKGIKFLQANDVEVHMFDRDLQEQIRTANKEFIEQALERAEAAKEEKEFKPVELSPLESVVASTELGDFSNEALEEFRSIAKIPDDILSPGFSRRLVQQGLLIENGKQRPSGFGLLLFGKQPRTVITQAGLLATIHFSGGGEETKDFDGPQVMVPAQVIDWLRQKLPNPIDRSEARRGESNKALFELVREGVVNALVHRDYSITGAKCQLVITSDTITIKSPGQPVEPITMEQLQSFDAPMLSRNPVLHYVFAQMELAEERGLGLKSMKNSAAKAGLPLPKYSWNAPYLDLTIYREAASAVRTLPTHAIDSLSQSERKGWEWIATQDSVTSKAYASAMSLPARTAQNHLKHFVALGLLSMHGSGPSTTYKVSPS